MLKILNPLIWCWNFFKYCGHLESYRGASEYQPYDFEKRGTPYF
jgi:hypothetical protein